MTTLLLAMMIGSSFGARAAPDEARAAIIKVADRVDRFEHRLTQFEARMGELRRGFRSENSSLLTQDAAAALALALRAWRQLDAEAERTQQIVRLTRTNLTTGLGLSKAAATYLVIKNHARDNPDFLRYLMASWLGSRYGEQVTAPPTQLRPRIKQGEIPFEAGTLVHLTMKNGGFVRGKIEGWTRDETLVLREVLPVALKRERHGLYRILNPNEISRIESIGIPLHINLVPGTAVATLNNEGNYNPTYSRPGQVERIHLALDDAELLSLALSDQFLRIRDFHSKMEPADLEQEKRPKYGGPIFDNCEYQLMRKRI
jgi:hypothetical protein